MPLDEVFYVVHTAMVVLVLIGVLVVVFVVVMVLLTLCLAVNSHLHMGAGDAALHRGHGGELHPREAKSVQFLNKFRALLFGKQLQKGPGEHIPGGAHVAVKIYYFHDCTSICIIP